MSEGAVQVAYDILILDGPSKKCSLLANLGTERFSILQKPVPMHVQQSNDFIMYSMCSYGNRFAFVSGGGLYR